MKEGFKKILIIVMVLLVTISIGVFSNAYAEETDNENSATSEESNSSLGEEIDAETNSQSITTVTEADATSNIPDMTNSSSDDDDNNGDNNSSTEENQSSNISLTQEEIKNVVIYLPTIGDYNYTLNKKNATHTLVVKVLTNTDDYSYTCKSSNSKTVSVTKTSNGCKVKALKGSGASLITITSKADKTVKLAAIVGIGSSTTTTTATEKLKSKFESVNAGQAAYKICYGVTVLGKNEMNQCVETLAHMNNLVEQDESTVDTSTTYCNKVVVKKGKSVKLKYGVQKGYEIKSVSSSNKKIATVKRNGTVITVKGVKKSNSGAKIKLTVRNKETKKEKTAKCTVKVTSSSSSKKSSSSSDSKWNWESLMCKTDVTVTVGKTKSLGCKADDGDKITSYKSSNTKVATVKNGKVTGKKKGTAKITVKSKKGNKETITVTVNASTKKASTTKKTSKKTTSKKSIISKKVTKVTITNCPSGKIKKNQSVSLKKTIEPSNASNKNVKWTSSKTSVAKVSSSGKVTGLAKGSTTITVTAQDGSKKKATCKIEVTDAVKTTSKTTTPKKMVVTENSKTIAVGNSATIKLQWTPNDATKTVSWKSSNSKVAKVSASGKITGVKAGEATITVTSSIDSNLVQKVKVTVIGQVKPTSIRFSSYNNIIVKGSTKKIGVILSPSDATSTGVTWKSSNTKIATVDKNGTVKGIKAGQVKITATSKVDKSIKATVKVVVTKDTSSFLSSTSSTVIVGKTYNLKSKVVSEDKASATYKSSNTKIATVDNNGIVTGVKKGTATISVTINGKTEKCKMTVKEQEATGITLNYTEVKVGVKKSTTVTATVIPDTATSKKVTWSSSNKKVATVKSGKITGVKAGTATITAKTSNGKKAKVTVTVSKDTETKTTTNNAVTGITMSKEEVTLGVTGKYKLTATVLPENASTKNVLWKSSRPEVATVSSTGEVEALKKGTTVITAYSAENKYIKGKTKITVQSEAIKATSFTLKDVTVEQGYSKTLSPVFVPDNTTNQNVTYTIENPEVATIDQTGKINGLNVGETTVTAVSEENNTLVASAKVIVTEKIAHAAPDITVNVSKTSIDGASGYKLTFKYNISDAKKLNIKIKEASSTANKKFSSFKIKSDENSFVTISEASAKKWNYTATVTAVAYRGKTKSETATIKVPLKDGSQASTQRTSSAVSSGPTTENNSSTTNNTTNNTTDNTSNNSGITGSITNDDNNSISSTEVTVSDGGSTTETIKDQNEEPSKYIFIGDSRTVGMQNAVKSSSKDIWSCKTSQGYNWMVNTGIPNVESKIKNNTAVIILMGVNDLYNSSKYISYINKKAKTWTKKGAKVYYVSVNPISSSYNSTSISHTDIKNFNKKMKKGLSKNVTYINTYDNLKFTTVDGLHYNNATYKNIYNYIKKSINK